MKKLFLYLLKIYSKTEEERKLVYRELHIATSEHYREQTGNGNLYNAAIEFIESSGIKNKSLIESLIRSSIDNCKL